MKLFVLYVDAWPYRYLDILLRSLTGIDGELLKYARLIPVYGYTDCFKVSLLTGMYPSEHGYWVSYGFTRSPRPRPLPPSLSPIMDIDVLPVRATRFVLNKALHVHMFHVKTWKHIHEKVVDPEAPITEIDGYLRNRGHRTLFQWFEEQSISYAVFEDRFYGHRLDVLAKLLIRKLRRTDVVFMYIDEPDFWGHKYGVESKHYLELLEWLSHVVSYIVKMAKRAGYGYIVFSDHGMATVKRFLDVYRYILRDPEYGRKYVVGIDATFLRIFYLSSNIVESTWLTRLRRLLLKYGKMLSHDDLKRYKLPMDRGYGDEVYALNEGVVLYPNFFSWLKPLGMHAYSPDNESQHGVVVSSGDAELGDTVYAPQLFSIIKDAMV